MIHSFTTLCCTYRFHFYMYKNILHTCTFKNISKYIVTSNMILLTAILCQVSCINQNCCHQISRIMGNQQTKRQYIHLQETHDHKAVFLKSINGLFDSNILLLLTNCFLDKTCESAPSLTHLLLQYINFEVCILSCIFLI